MIGISCRGFKRVHIGNNVFARPVQCMPACVGLAQKAYIAFGMDCEDVAIVKRFRCDQFAVRFSYAGQVFGDR